MDQGSFSGDAEEMRSTIGFGAIGHGGDIHFYFCFTLLSIIVIAIVVTFTDRSRIRYLSKKIANFIEFSEIKFVQKFVKCPSRRGLPVE